jgi:hypothetical protein
LEKRIVAEIDDHGAKTPLEPVIEVVDCGGSFKDFTPLAASLS